MTGKERLEYEKWKKEQDLIDAERIRLHKDEMGHWKREWDQHKPLDRWNKLINLISYLCDFRFDLFLGRLRRVDLITWVRCPFVRTSVCPQKVFPIPMKFGM